MKQQAKYLEIYRLIRSEIESGAFPYNSRMPSKRVAAERYAVSVITIEHAYELLTDEGYITARERSGYFVSFRERDSFAVAQRRTPTSLTQPPAAQGNSFPFSVYAKAMRRVISEYGERLFVKSPNYGLAELRCAIARYLARNRGMNAKPEQIIIGSGAEYLYGLVVQLLGREPVYGLEKPSYEKIEKVYRANGISCELLPLGHDGIENRALRETGARVLHITPYRSYPSDVTATAAKKHAYLRWAEERDAVIIEDDFESEFSSLSKPEDTVFSMDRCGRVIYINTFSKTISPAVRIGYMVVPEKLLGQLEERTGYLSCTVPTQDQYILTELLDSGDFERHLNRVRRRNRKT